MVKLIIISKFKPINLSRTGVNPELIYLLIFIINLKLINNFIAGVKFIAGVNFKTGIKLKSIDNLINKTI